MKTPKTIAIIGATGNTGSAIAASLAKGNNRLLLMSPETDKLEALKARLEKEGSAAELYAVSCSKEASWEADIIVVATPYEAEKEVAEKIREVAVGKIVISISNPVYSRYNDLVVAPASSAAEELQKLLPNSKVVKTFNTTPTPGFVSPFMYGKSPDAFIAGNNGDAVEVVSSLVKAAGFNPILAGDLSVSRTLEKMQLMFSQRSMKNSYNHLASWKFASN